MTVHWRELPIRREAPERRPPAVLGESANGEDVPQAYDRPRKVLAVASGGGHWVQLLRTLPAFEGADIAYVTTLASYRQHVEPAQFYTICDANLWTKFRLARMALKMLWIIVRERPDLVISTGAACGYFALRMGKWFGARTIWVDSIANAEKLSLSGRKVGPYADLWLTQWPHLARAEGPRFEGAVL